MPPTSQPARPAPTKPPVGASPTTSLLALAKHYEPRKPTGSQLKGSNPNGKPPADADTTTKAPGPPMFFTVTWTGAGRIAA